MELPYRMEIVEDKDKGGYVISFPELPGCIPSGETIEAAIQKGLQTICITDHHDVDYTEPNFLIDFANYFPTLRELQEKYKNQINVRKNICNHLKFMGLEIDEKINNVRGEEILITKPESKIKAYIIPTNEELVIARDTKKLVNNE